MDRVFFLGVKLIPGEYDKEFVFKDLRLYKNMKLKIIIIVVLISVICLIYFFLKNEHKPIVNNLSPEEVSQGDVSEETFSVENIEWSTYTNNTYGYTIEVPTKANIEIDTNDRGVRIWLRDALIGDITIPRGGIDWEDRFQVSISPTQATPGLTVDEWAKNEVEQRQAPIPNAAFEKITLDGEDAYYLEYSYGSSSPRFRPYGYGTALVIHNDIQYRITGLKLGTGSDFTLKFAEQADQIFDAMLDSLRFTK